MNINETGRNGGPDNTRDSGRNITEIIQERQRKHIMDAFNANVKSFVRGDQTKRKRLMVVVFVPGVIPLTIARFSGSKDILALPYNNLNQEFEEVFNHYLPATTKDEEPVVTTRTYQLAGFEDMPEELVSHIGRGTEAITTIHPRLLRSARIWVSRRQYFSLDDMKHQHPLVETWTAQCPGNETADNEAITSLRDAYRQNFSKHSLKTY